MPFGGRTPAGYSKVGRGLPVQHFISTLQCWS